MNKIFDLFILDVYLNTLQEETNFVVIKLDTEQDHVTTDLPKKAYLSFVEQWPMKTQHSFT